MQHRNYVTITILRGGASLDRFNDQGPDNSDPRNSHGILRTLLRRDERSRSDRAGQSPHGPFQDESQDSDDQPAEEPDRPADSDSRMSQSGSAADSAQFPAGSGGRLLTKAELQAQNLLDSDSSRPGSELGAPAEPPDGGPSPERMREACIARMEAYRRRLLDRVPLPAPPHPRARGVPRAG
jgi:hypothetical protein